MNCTAVELNDVTILRRRLPQRQDSTEHHECYVSVSNTAVEFNDVVFRRRRLLRTEVFAEGVEEKYIAPRTDSVSAEQNNLTFRRPKTPRRVVSTNMTFTVVVSKEILRHPNRVTTHASGGVCRRTQPLWRSAAWYIGT